MNVLDASLLEGLSTAIDMTDEPATSSEESSPKPEVEAAPIVRRISNPRPKKVPRTVTPEPVEAPEEPATAPVTEADEAEPESSDGQSSQEGAEWPEPDAETEGGAQTQSDSAKRKRRRRKGKGQGAAAPQAGAPPVAEEGQHVAVQETKAPEANQDQRPRNPGGQQQQPQQQRPKIDPELLTKMAWKIYLAEVSEEGVALIGDNDARDLSRRCFRLAEIFVEEQTRRR